MARVRVVLACSLLLVAGCITTTEKYLKRGYSIDSYEYVAVRPPDAPYYHDLNLQVEQGLSRLGFKVVSSSQWLALAPREKARALLCQVRPDQFSRVISVTLEFFDRDLDRLFTFTGKLSLGGFMSSDGALAAAADAALKEVGNSYAGYRPSAAASAVDKWAQWEKIPRSREELTAYFDDNVIRLDPIEGMWTSTEGSQYQLAIFRDSVGGDRDFVATIVRSEEPEWSEYQVKAEFQRTAYSGVYSTTYYMRNHSRQGTTTRVLSGGGKLSMTLSDYATGDTYKSEFIKNYPANAEGDGQPEPSPEASSGASTGSGFLLSETGLVVTNYHVIENAHTIEAVFPAVNEVYTATVAVKDKGNDLAILKLDKFVFSGVSKRPIPYTVAHSGSVKLGQEVYTLGFPLGALLGTSAKLSTGTVSSLYGMQDDPRLFQISNPLQPGNSGGPLFDADGRLIGVVVASLNARYFYEMADIIPQNVNFAVKSDYLSNLVSMLPEDDEVRQRTNRLAGQSIVNQVELVSPYVVTVRTR